MGVQKRIGSTLVLATVMIASLGTAHAQNASDIVVRGLGRMPGCGGPAYQVEVQTTSAEYYYDVLVDAEFSSRDPGPDHCVNGDPCSGRFTEKQILAPCRSPGYCVGVDGGNSTGFPACCNIPSYKCNSPSSTYCVTTDRLEVTLFAFSSDGMTWTLIDPQVVCKLPAQDGYPLCGAQTMCSLHPVELCRHHPACLLP